MLAKEKLSSELASSNLDSSTQVWKGVRRIRSSNKIKHFIWRAENLCKRQILLDATCSLCEDHQENTLHALWLCDQAQAVWKSKFSLSLVTTKVQVIHGSF